VQKKGRKTKQFTASREKDKKERGAKKELCKAQL
jgi:hypothetical protein